MATLLATAAAASPKRKTSTRWARLTGNGSLATGPSHRDIRGQRGVRDY